MMHPPTMPDQSDRPAGRRQNPNIILINCDDLGYGDPGCYGSKENQTPAVDRLAAEGMKFTDFYMASPVCTPSRGAMMTGCYPPRIGFGSFEGLWVLFPGQPLGLNPDEMTVAKALKQSGYATKLVGKWHCGDQKEFLPTRHGFDEYYGLPYSNDMGRQRMDDVYPPLPLMNGEEVLQEQPDQCSLTERYVEQSVRFIRENKDRPFFLYLAHMHVHLPIFTPERFLRESENGRYGAAVAAIDWSTRVLMDELDRLGLSGDTLVVFTSDNGSRCNGEGGSNGNLRGVKGTTWEGGQRVPCVMRWPGVIPAGTVCREVASAMDFLPTFAAITDTELPEGRPIDGRNILPLLRSGGTEPSPNPYFFYYMGNVLEAVRDAKWKLHVRKGDQPLLELYDLENDPGETSNLFNEHPEVVRRLSAALDACRDDLGDEACGIEGANTRPAGRVEHPETLTHYDPEHPYICAMYDLMDRG